MAKERLFYVVAEPQNKGDFRPVVIEYGVSLANAERIVRHSDLINTNGLRIKIGDTKHPAFIRIMQISDKLPDNYVLVTKAEVVK